MLAKNALTTLERMNMILGLPTPSDKQINAIVELFINRASAWVERQTGRRFGKQSYRQWCDADGQRELITREYPIISVEYIKEAGKIVDPDSYDYSQDGAIGVIYRDEGWLKAGYRRGLAYDSIDSRRAIEVKYTAGYILPKDASQNESQALPADLEGLVWDMVARQYSAISHGASGLKSFTLSDVTWVFDKSIPTEWEQIINLYKRY